MIRPEDDPKINQIVLNLRRSKDIACILLVLFNDEILRQDVEAEIRRRLAPEEFNFRELRMTKDMYKNVPVIITREMNPQPNDIFFVYDLKEALPEVLEYLNYRREDFVEHKISVVFWLDEPTLIKIMRKALDFFAFRSSPVIEFMADKSRDMAIPGQTTLSDTYIYDSLEELDNKITLREEMLSDYLEKRPDDSSTIADLHNGIGLLYDNKSDLNGAMTYYEKALELYKKMRERKGEANALGNIGNVYRNKGELDRALEAYLQALQIHKRLGYAQGEASDLSNMGIVYQLKGELDKALECYSQALEIDRRIGFAQGEASALGNIGVVYRNKGELNKALDYHSQALEIHKRIGYAQGEASALNSMGNVYYSKGEPNEALECYSQALEIDRRIGFAQGEASALSSMGNVYYSKGEPNEALECYSQALEIDERIGYTQGEAIALGNMGNVYYSKGDLNKALEYTKRAFGIFISIGVPMSADIFYGNLQRIMEQMIEKEVELSEEDKKEIAELIEQYEKLKGTQAVPAVNTS